MDTLSNRRPLLLVQGSAYLVNLNMQLHKAGGSLPEGLWFDIYAIVVMAAGSMFVLWLGERITDKVRGNGVSPDHRRSVSSLASQELCSPNGGRAPLWLRCWGLDVVPLRDRLPARRHGRSHPARQGTRRVPVQYAKRVVGNKQYGEALASTSH